MTSSGSEFEVVLRGQGSGAAIVICSCNGIIKKWSGAAAAFSTTEILTGMCAEAVAVVAGCSYM